MSKTGKRGRLLAAFLAVAGRALAGCDGKPAGSTRHSGGVVDGWAVWGHGPAGQRHSANTLRETSKELWRVSLSAGGHSALQNKQGDYVIAYALP